MVEVAETVPLTACNGPVSAASEREKKAALVLVMLASVVEPKVLARIIHDGDGFGAVDAGRAQAFRPVGSV